VTVTVSGVTCNSGDAGTDAEVEGLINSSYVVDLDCVAGDSATFTFTGFTITASVEFDYNTAPGGQTASIQISGTSQNGFSVTGSASYDEDGPARIPHQCSLLLDCSDFSGTATVASNFGVLGGTATISVTGV
jgi:hypothetical protein